MLQHPNPTFRQLLEELFLSDYTFEQGCKQRIFRIFRLGKKAFNSRWGYFAF